MKTALMHRIAQLEDRLHARRRGKPNEVIFEDGHFKIVVNSPDVYAHWNLSTLTDAQLAVFGRLCDDQTDAAHSPEMQEYYRIASLSGIEAEADALVNELGGLEAIAAAVEEIYPNRSLS